MSDLRSLAERLARTAGAVALDGRRTLSIGLSDAYDTKSSATDPVTEFDRRAEATIVDILRAERPDDAIVGEEGAADDGTSGLEWHIDPIDGTANFVYDLPAWCTSVAVVDDAGPLAASVYAPVTNELYSAARGAGATLDDRRLSVTTTSSLSLAMIGTGFSYLEDRRRRQADRLRSLVPLVRDVRRYGSAALDLCFVAAGRLDAYFEEHLNSWDYSAGILIAAEAGAITSDFSGGSAGEHETVAAAPGIHAALLEAIATASDQH